MKEKVATVFRGREAWLKWVLPGAVACFLLLGCFAWANKTVVLEADGSKTTVQTFSRTVGGLLESQNITLLDKDEVVPSPETPLRNGMEVKVSRAADLTITVDGCDLPVRTMCGKVADVLAEYGVCLGPDDQVEPAVDALVSPGMTVRVARVRIENQVHEVPLSFETKKEYTTKLPAGSSRVAQEGKEGRERQTWRVTYKDGIESDRQLLAREVVEPATDRIVVVGSNMVVSRGGDHIRYSRVLDMLASGYTYTGNNTASGVAPHYGVAAVDTRRIPMGTKLYVDGYGYATALDRGGAIKGNRIDLFFESRDKAMGWGLRWVKVYILD